MAGTLRRYAKAKDELLAAMTSTSFSTWRGTFPQRKMVLGEAQPVFLHDLKQLLEQAMSGLDSSAKEHLAGIPLATRKQLRATGSTTELRTTVENAKLLTSLENEQHSRSLQ
eukprot:Em0004g1094a